MVAPTRSSDNPLSRLTAQAREQPLVYDGVRPELCPALTEVILDRMKHDRGKRVGSLNVGGWKSSEDVFAWPEAPVQDLRRTIVDMIGHRSPVAWAMVNRAGSQHPRHQHRIAYLFGVFYVTSGDPRIPTICECPCDGRPTKHELAIDPEPGRLVLCRGETWHRLEIYPGDLPRITIVFDVRR